MDRKYHVKDVELLSNLNPRCYVMNKLENKVKLIIYGINEDTLHIISSIKRIHDIVAISDGLRHEEYMYGYPFCIPEKLCLMSFDYIIVCVRKKKTFDAILKNIISCGISKDCVLSFHNLYYESRVDQVMLYAKAKNKIFDGLILGISHAAYAINPMYLDGDWANVAAPSEDIINHNYVIDKIATQYIDQVRNLKKVIIDIYDYTVLNFITSYSRYNVEFYDLYCGDGIEHQTNFLDLELKIRNRENYSTYYARCNRELRKMIFNDEIVFLKYHNRDLLSPTPIDFFYKECVYTDNELDLSNINMTYIPKVQRDSNIAINKKQLSMLIDKIFMLNKDMKVYLVLIPRIAEIEEMSGMLMNYKKTLYKEIENLMHQYPNITFLDYKGVNEISLFREGFCSVAHMNTKGQQLFTSILNRDISKGDA